MNAKKKIKKVKTTKPWYESKLIWTGTLAILTAVVQALETGADWKAAVLAGFGALVLVLRPLTNKALTK